jgi:GT2 family glycosyltransferase
MEMAKEPIDPSDCPICSVCIANYNGMGIIDAALRSAIAQDCDIPIEIIVYDDASTDGSAEFIRKNYPDVKLIVGELNAGFCVSNNRMVSKAMGEYILLLNNDAELLPDAVSTLYKEACRQDTPGILGLPQYNFFTENLIDRGILFDPFVNTVPNFSTKRTDVGMVIGACLWIPKALWEELGGFPEWFHTLGEDMFLCCLARLRGYPVKIIHTSGFKHRVGNSLGGGKVVMNRLSTSKKRRTFSERNKSFVIALTYPAPFFQLIFPLHIMLLLIEGALLNLLKKDPKVFRSIYIFCVRSLWHERKRLYHLRKRIQSLRRISPWRFFTPFIPIPYKLLMLIKYGVPEIN